MIQRSVLYGDEPAREVIHDSENNWLVADGVSDPTLRDAWVASHIWHVIGQNSSTVELASLPLSHMATREGPGSPWIIASHEYPDE